MPEDANSFALEFRLRELDPDLHTRFTDCVFVLQKILSNYKLLFPEYTDHSELHSLTVIQFCNTLIGEQLNRLNKNEIYVLLSGCYFHDTGMGITRKVFEAFSREIDFGDYFESEKVRLKNLFFWHNFFQKGRKKEMDDVRKILAGDGDRHEND